MTGGDGTETGTLPHAESTASEGWVREAGHPSQCSGTGRQDGSKEQASFNFMAAVTIYSDFGDQENKVYHCFPIYLP